MSTHQIRRIDLLRVGLRLLLLQCAWSEGTLQSAGLAYCLTPGLRRIHRTPDALAEALKRARAPFNTHPYLAGAVAGALLRMELDGQEPKRIAAFVRESMGPLAAVGDPFFRGALAPAVTLVAAVTALLAGPLVGAAVLAVLFNAVHLGLRIATVTQGFGRGEQVLARTGRWIAPRRTRPLKWIAAAAGGVVLGLIAGDYGGSYPGLATILVAVGGLSAAALFALRRATWSYAVPAFFALMVFVEVVL